MASPSHQGTGCGADATSQPERTRHPHALKPPRWRGARTAGCGPALAAALVPASRSSCREGNGTHSRCRSSPPLPPRPRWRYSTGSRSGRGTAPLWGQWEAAGSPASISFAPSKGKADDSVHSSQTQSKQGHDNDTTPGQTVTLAWFLRQLGFSLATPPHYVVGLISV